MNIKNIKKYAVMFLYPNRCRFCGRVVDMRIEVCSVCEENKQEITGEICTLCGCKKSDCKCKGHKHFYKAAAAPYYYSGAAGSAIKNLKFNRRTEYADYLAEDMASCFSERFGEYSFDCLTFVPSAKNERKARGFNQAELLCKGVSEKTDIPYLPVLTKQFETAPQHTLPENERSGNILGVFKVDESFDIKDMRILLIDDVKTTGSTLNECAKTLLIAGAAEVFCLTAAIVKSSKPAEQDDNADW